MNKDLHAIKYKDGWLVEIKETKTVKTKSDVYKEIRQNGFRKHPEIVKGQIYTD